MALQLAGAYYGDPAIFEGIIAGSFWRPITAREEEGQWVIHVPEVVEPKQDFNIIIRGGSIQLIALLESGDLDYAFEYESVSQQQGFHFVALPDPIDMGTEAYGPQYSQVKVRLDFQRFASVRPVLQGEFIGYGATVPSNAPHPDQATEFVAFLLGPEGEEIMEADHHPVIRPPRLDRYDRAPEAVRELCVPMR
jgi:molybdate/tungstate transport system substrate-binding protein